MNFEIVNLYDEKDFSKDAISSWGEYAEDLIEDEGLLHVQMGHLARLCKNDTKKADVIFKFLENLLEREDTVSEIENAVAISFLTDSEIQEFENKLRVPNKIREVIREYWKVYGTNV